MAKQCKKCGYERQPTDTQPEIECPKCGAIYAKIEQLLARQKQDMEKKQSEKAAQKIMAENTVQARRETSLKEYVGIGAFKKVLVVFCLLAVGVPVAYFSVKKIKHIPSVSKSRNTPAPLEPEMVAVKGGDFLMGSPRTGRENTVDAEKQHKLYVADFEMGKYEVTKGQFAAFVSETHYQTHAETSDGCYGWTGSSTGSKFEQSKKYNWKNLGFEQTDQHPVACVSWDDAQTYIIWLNKKTGKNYHLPTEAQWEYAARAGTTTAYPWGDVASHEYANYGSDSLDPLISGKDEWLFTAPVGSFAAYKGLHDMHGNVDEWTGSDYDQHYSGKQISLSENKISSFMGNAWVGRGREELAVRGGSWSYDANTLRSAARYSNEPDDRDPYTGFRLARL